MATELDTRSSGLAGLRASGKQLSGTTKQDSELQLEVQSIRAPGSLFVLGLPDRYRHFLRPFESEERKLLLILWLGHPHRDGDRNDFYTVFSRMVQQGDLPDTWASLEEQLSNTEL